MIGVQKYNTLNGGGFFVNSSRRKGVSGLSRKKQLKIRLIKVSEKENPAKKNLIIDLASEILFDYLLSKGIISVDEDKKDKGDNQQAPNGSDNE